MGVAWESVLDLSKESTDRISASATWNLDYKMREEQNENKERKEEVKIHGI